MESQYRTKFEKTKCEVFKYHNDQAGWHRHNDHKGVEVYSKPSPHFNGHFYKFEFALDYRAEDVYEVMKPPPVAEGRLEWDKSVKDYTVLDVISEDLLIGVFVTHSVLGGLIASREFVDLYGFVTDNNPQDKRYEAIYWVIAENIEHSKRPPSNNVRGLNYPTGYGVAKLKSDPTKSRMIMYVNCNIGGMIPQSLVEKALPGEQVAYMKSLSAEVKRRLVAETK